MSRFLDTNVLLYSISSASADQRKREIAIQALQRHDNVLSTQVLQEFYVQGTRATRPDPLPHQTATGFIESWTRFPICGADIRLVRAALALRERYRWSYRDSAIVAAAQLMGCDELWSEDLQYGQVVDGLRIFDPFADT